MPQETSPYVPRRAIHLDFHTGPDIPDVGAEFDPRAFARTFVEAHVDSVTVFAKCHHGLMYLDTDHPARHPNLQPGLDLVAEQVDALHAVGIRAPVYVSVQCDEFAANAHPDWIALTPELRQVKFAPSAFEAGWQILDMSSPYQDYVADQLDLVLRRLAPVDGVFLDMCWDQPSVSRWAVDGMRRGGFDPTDENDRSRYARQVARGYMERFRDMIRAARQGDRPASIFFNSRPRILAGQERDLVTHQEIESLPTGGWGYGYTPFVGRFVRGQGIPALGMTARFHESWGDNTGLKPLAALTYECLQVLALGSGVSVGDVLRPPGTTQPAAYRLIGRVFERLAACQPYVEGARARTEVAVLVTPNTNAGRTFDAGPDAAQTGAVKVLQQVRQQFDVVTPGVDLSRYRVVVVPETTRAAEIRQALQGFLADGGAVLIAGEALVDRGPGNPADVVAPADSVGTPLLPELGSHLDVLGESPYTHTFLRPTGELAAALRASGDPDAPYDSDTVGYERGLRLRLRAGAKPEAGKGSGVLAHVVEPYFERSFDRFCGHAYTPPARVTEDAAIVEAGVGAGRVIAIGEPLFGGYARHGNPAYREIVRALLDRLLPDPLLRAKGPAHLETAVHEQDPRDGHGARTVVHLVSFLPARHGEHEIVSDPFPVVDLELAVRREQAPTRVRLEPAGRDLPFRHENGYLHTTLDLPDGHGLVVVE